MKDQHTTNYFDTFIEVAEDYSESTSRLPVKKGDKKTVALKQYELVAANPYRYTSDDVLFQVFADKNEIDKSEYESVRAAFFSKGQPCFRASPLTKSHGFGLHSNQQGKIALYPVESETYQTFLNDATVRKVKAMRTSRK